VFAPRGDIHVPPAEVSKHQDGRFVSNEPHPFVLAFLYIARKGEMRQSILELLFYLGDLIKKPPRGKKSVPFKIVCYIMFFN